jgi:hypothetical protein
LFVAETDFATLEKVRSVDIMPPSTYNRRIPEELEQIVMRALARDRDQRYQTALQLHDELQAFMHTSGNLFSRKDLSGYMHRVFAEEIERESARDQEYAQLGTPSFVAEPSGLEVFDEIDPVSTVSALHAQPLGLTPAPNPVAAAARARKATLLGIPQVANRAPVKVAPAVPRLVPRLQSVPPQGGVPARATIGSSARLDSVPPIASPFAPAPSSPGPQLTPPIDPRVPRAPSDASMEWDDEELSTQIYDKPDDYSLSFVFGAKSAESMPSAPPDALIAPAYAPPEPQLAAAALPYRAEPLQYRPEPAAYAEPQPQLPEVPPWERKPKTSPAVVAVLVTFGIIAAIVIGLVIFGGTDPGNVHLSTIPNRVSVAVDGQMLASTTSPFVLARLPAKTPHTIEVSQQGYRPYRTKVELQPGQTIQLPTVTLERIESGFSIDSDPPGANVLVDGKSLAQTPARLIDLPPGEHKIRLEREGYGPWDSVLHVSTGTVLPLQSVSLQAIAPPPATGRSRSSSSSDGSSRHRSRESATDDDTSEPTAPSSSHSRKHSSESADSASGSEAAPEDVLSIGDKPEKAEKPDPAPSPEPSAEASDSLEEEASGPGTLRVNSRPWAQVFVDGKLYGVTPQRSISLSAGTHTLVLVNDEFNIRKQLEIEIHPGKVTTQVLTLAE